MALVNLALPAAADLDAERRRHLRRLDACLELLERGHEAGLTVVNAVMSEAISGRVASVVPGLTITEAIERVFTAQEPYLLPAPPVRELRQRPVARRSRNIVEIIGRTAPVEGDFLTLPRRFDRRG